jgi:hypothetical protein
LVCNAFIQSFYFNNKTFCSNLKKKITTPVPPEKKEKENTQHKTGLVEWLKW